MDLLKRNEAPLTAAEWATIDEAVRQVAETNLVGRRMLPIYGPLGGGVQTVINDIFRATTIGGIDLLGQSGEGKVMPDERHYLPLPLIYKDFRMHWRDIDAFHHGLPLDVGAAAVAAAWCARAEDQLIFSGDQRLGIEGLTTASGRLTRKMGDWSQEGSAFSDIVAATAQLLAAGFDGPWAVAASPARYAQMNRVFGNTGVLELEQVEKIARAGVYQTPALSDQVIVVLSVGAENVDLALGLEMTVAYLDVEEMDHLFRVLESAVPRIKRPQAILTIEAS